MSVLVIFASACGAVVGLAVYVEWRRGRRLRELEAEAARERRRSWDRLWRQRRNGEAMEA
jgi:hypothetical protein